VPRQCGQASVGGRHFFPSASLREKNRAVRYAKQAPRQSRPSLAGPVTVLAASPSDKRRLSDAALATPRPRPPPGGSPPGSALHNGSLCKLARTATTHTRRPLRGRPALSPFCNPCLRFHRESGAALPSAPACGAGAPLVKVILLL